MSACSDCRFFNPKELRHYLGPVPAGEPIKGHGFCRANSPVADATGTGRFPIISQDEWCGDHEPKGEAQ